MAYNRFDEFGREKPPEYAYLDLYFGSVLRILLFPIYLLIFLFLGLGGRD